MVRVAGEKTGDIDINKISNNRFRSIRRYTKLEKQQSPGYRQDIK